MAGRRGGTERFLPIVGVGLVGVVYSVIVLFWLVGIFVWNHSVTEDAAVVAASGLVLAGVAALGWFLPLLTGIVLICPIAFPFGLVGLLGGTAWVLLITVGVPALVGVVFLAAGLLRLARDIHKAVTSPPPDLDVGAQS